MIYRTKPYTVLCYEALFRWLLPKFRENKTLIEEYASHRAGYYGEKSADYFITSYPHSHAYIFQGLRLKNGSINFQIDNLILTPMVIFIIEIKNLKGELQYNPRTKQLIQIDGEERRSQKNPILQADNQKRQFILWLQQNGFPSIPIETIGVSTNPSSILTYLDEDKEAKFIQLETLPTTFDNLYTKFTRSIYNQTVIRKLNKKLVQENNPLKPDLINQFRIKEQHLAKGIVCSKCGHFPLIYKKRKRWECGKCGDVDPTAHEQKIYDYFLLFEPTITNRVCREILQINSPKIARRILNSMNLEYSGNNRARKYHAPPLEKYPQNSKIPGGNRSIFGD